MEPMKGTLASSQVDLGYTELLCIRNLHQCSYRFVTVFLGTLCCSIKKIEAPYMFDWGYGIALHAMQGNRASFPSEGDVSYDFSSCGRSLGYIRELQRGWPFETPLFQQSQDSGVVMRDTSGIYIRLGRIIQTLMQVRWETKCPFLVSTVIFGFLSIFKNSEASSAFEVLNSTSLSRCQGM